MHTALTGLISLAVVASSFGTAAAQVTYLSQLREVSVSASADYSDFQNVEFANDSVTAPDFGPFDEFITVTAASDVASGTARARQDSMLLGDRITVSGYADGSTSGGSTTAGFYSFSNGRTDFRTEIQTAEDLRFHVTGTLDPTNSGRASVDILDSSQGLVYSRSASGGANYVLNDLGFLPAGTYTVLMSARGSGFSGSTYGSSGSLDINIAFEEALQRHCVSQVNSSGMAASIDVTGSTSVSANDFGLIATGAPAQTFGLFFYGADRAMSPFGDGSLCVGGTIQRLVSPVLIDATGTASLALDLSSPAIASGPNPIEDGSLFSLQFWFRDNAAGGAGFNTSDAIEAYFTQ